MKIKTKNVLKSIATIIIIAVISTCSGLYIGNAETKEWVDKNILKKELSEDDLKAIDIENENTRTIAFNSKIATVADNKLIIYDSNAKKIKEINVEIKSPIFYTNGTYLLVADSGSSNIYLIDNLDLLWSKKLDGNISKIYVNEIGKAAAVLTGTSYKSIIEMFDDYGDEEFKTYLSDSIITDLAISPKGDTLSYIDANISGALIINKVKTIDVNLAKSDPTNSLKYNYEFDNDELLLKISIKRDGIIAFSNKCIYLLKDGNKNQLYSVTDKEQIIDISLNRQYLTLEESSDKQGKQIAKLVDIYNNQEHIFSLDEIVKEVFASKEIIAINAGNEVYFINTSANLKKKFITTSNILSISISNDIAAIIYKNRIEILKI